MQLKAVIKIFAALELKLLYLDFNRALENAKDHFTEDFLIQAQKMKKKGALFLDCFYSFYSLLYPLSLSRLISMWHLKVSI